MIQRCFYSSSALVSLLGTLVLYCVGKCDYEVHFVSCNQMERLPEVLDCVVIVCRLSSETSIPAAPHLYHSIFSCNT